MRKFVRPCRSGGLVRVAGLAGEQDVGCPVHAIRRRHPDWLRSSGLALRHRRVSGGRDDRGDLEGERLVSAKARRRGAAGESAALASCSSGVNGGVKLVHLM